MEYSDLIFNEFEKFSNKLEELDKKNNYAKEVIEIINKIENVIKNKNLDEIEELIKNINEIKLDEELLKIIKEFLNLSKIAIKINNTFEQYDEYLEKINNIKNSYKEILKNYKEEYKELKGKIKILEYIDKIGLPIDDEEVIKDIIKRCKEESTSPIYVLKLINEGNIKTYNYEKDKQKKEEYLTIEKMKSLDIDEEMQELILEVKELTKNIKSEGTDGMINYLLTLKDEELLEKAIENLFVLDKNFILGVLKNLLDRINNKEDVIELFSSIYFKYLEKNSFNEINDEKKSKLIYLVKPTSNTPYVYDDIDKIESKILRQRLKGQFKELTYGNTTGKPLTMSGMFEKKRFKVRITFTMLPNNYILIISCYQKGTNGITKTKERLNPSSTAQIMLYKALINNDKQELEKAINYITKSLKISMDEINNYISNFETMQKIDILDYFEKGGETK